MRTGNWQKTESPGPEEEWQDTERFTILSAISLIVVGCSAIEKSLA
jgi:hypothetical protein